MRAFLIFVLASIAASVQALPSWLPLASQGFLEGFLSAHSNDVETCLAASLGPISNFTGDMEEAKVGIKERNVTDIGDGFEALGETLKDLKEVMQKCQAAEDDIIAIEEVMKSSHSLGDVIKHIKSDVEADINSAIAQDFELMARSFVEKKYQDFGRYLGDMLHRLVVGPEGTILGSLSCKGSGDPPGSYPMCYEGSAGALGVKENVKVRIDTYANGKGNLGLQGSGVKGFTCTGKPFAKNGQEIALDLGDCLPKEVSIKKILYCSNTDTIAVTVKVAKVPLPVSATVKKVACSTSTLVV